DAVDFDDAAAVPDMLNAPALRQAMEHALLRFRYVQGSCLSSDRTPRKARAKAHAHACLSPLEQRAISGWRQSLTWNLEEEAVDGARCIARAPSAQRLSSITAKADSWVGA